MNNFRYMMESIHCFLLVLCNLFFIPICLEDLFCVFLLIFCIDFIDLNVVLYFHKEDGCYWRFEHKDLSLI